MKTIVINNQLETFSKYSEVKNLLRQYLYLKYDSITRSNLTHNNYILKSSFCAKNSNPNAVFHKLFFFNTHFYVIKRWLYIFIL